MKEHLPEPEPKKPRNPRIKSPVISGWGQAEGWMIVAIPSGVLDGFKEAYIREGLSSNQAEEETVQRVRQSVRKYVPVTWKIMYYDEYGVPYDWGSSPDSTEEE
jgi:hypothetical protein